MARWRWPMAVCTSCRLVAGLRVRFIFGIRVAAVFAAVIPPAESVRVESLAAGVVSARHELFLNRSREAAGSEGAGGARRGGGGDGPGAGARGRRGGGPGRPGAAG